VLNIRWISVRWLVRWTPVLILLLAAFWRFQDLATQSFWNDEGNTLRLIQRDLDPLLDAAARDIHPPGYYLLLKAWTTFIGENEFGLRSLSVFWGVLAVAFTYALGARLYARGAGIVAALLVAMNALQVYYSQEARMYAQLSALSVMSLYFMARLVTARRPLGWAIGLALVNALGLYTHYTFPFTMLVQGLFFLWAWWQKRSSALVPYIVANLVALALFAPWLPTAYDQLTNWPSATTAVSLTEKIRTIATYITYGNSASSLGLMDFFWPGLLLAACILPDWYRNPPSNRWRVWLPLAWMLVVCGALLTSGAYREANLKFLLPAQIALALLLGRSIYLLWDVGSGSAATPLEMLPRLVAGAAFLAVVGNTNGWLQEVKNNQAFWRDDYRGIAEYIEANGDDEDAIILNAPGQQEVFTFYYHEGATLYPIPRGYGGDDAATRAETLDILSKHQRIFVIFWGEGERDPNDIVRQTLDEGAYQILSRWYGDVRLVEYGVLASPPPEPENETEVAFGESILLQGYSLSGEIQPGNVIGVTLYWQAETQLTERYKVFVQVLNEEGALVVQHDGEPGGNRLITTDWVPRQTIIDNHGILLPPDLNSGTYTIIVGLYALDPPNTRLPVNGGDTLTLERISLP
jgi:mannosyltransferase